MDTFSTRKSIGFPEKKEQWNEVPAVFTEHALKIGGHPVMEDWEHEYMDTLAEIAASQGGSVLELGYGMGLSTSAIQARGVDTHIVIECHPDVIAKCLEDFRHPIESGRMHVFTGFWQDVTPRIESESFDGILFDTYPLNEEEIHSNHFWFFEEAYRLLKPGGILTYYSDEVSHFSQKHLAKLHEAGFGPESIDYRICNVKPPADCEYWQADTILAPIIRKQFPVAI